MSITLTSPIIRTEIEVAADTIAALMDVGLLQKTPAVVREACAAAMIPTAALRQAWARRARTITERPQAPQLVKIDTSANWHTPPVHRESNHPAAVNLQVHNQQEWAKKNPEPGMRICSNQNPLDHQAKATLPVAQFAFKGGGQLRTMCKKCEARIRAERTVYLLKGQRAIIVEVVPDDDFVGHTCLACSKPFKVGEHVRGDDLRHEHCKAMRRR